MKHQGKRLLALLLALVMTAGLLPMLELDTSASLTGSTQPKTAGTTSETTVGTRDLTDVVSLPITIRDYDNDGMLFEFASYYPGSDTAIPKTVTDDYITMPSPAKGYNMTALQKFGGSKSMIAADMSYGPSSNYIYNGYLKYHFGEPYNARYVTLTGYNDGTSSPGGYGLGARALVRNGAQTGYQYAVIRYRVVSDDNDDGVDISFLLTQGSVNASMSSPGNLYCCTFDGLANDADPSEAANRVILELYKETSSDWRTAVIDLYAASVASKTYIKNGNTETYSSYQTLSAASTINSAFLCLDYGKEDVIDVSCVAFFQSLTDEDAYFNNDVRHFIYQDDCYRTGKTSIDSHTEQHSRLVGKPTFDGTVCLDISSGQEVYTDVGGTETIATATVAEGYSELGSSGELVNHARYLSLTDTGRGYGVGFRALLMNNMGGGSGITMSTMRYALVRYRIDDPGRSTASSIPMYLMAEVGSYGSGKKTVLDFGEGNYSNKATTLARFNALTDGEWHTALVDFSKCVNQYPTGEAYYCHGYNGSDLVYRLGLADFYAIYGNTIELAYVHCFNTQAKAEAFRDAYDDWAANGYREETVTETVTIAAYNAQMGNSESRTYRNGNNVGFGFLHASQDLRSSYGNYYVSSQIANASSKFTKWSDNSSGSINCNNIIGTALTHRLYTMGLVKDEMGENGPVYEPEAVSYLADLLKKTLNVPKSFVLSDDTTVNYSYNYVAGVADGEKYGYYDEAAGGTQFPRDLAGWLRWRMGITNQDGSLTGSDAPDYTALGRAETYADTDAHKAGLTGSWASCKGNIQTYTDAAYYLLNNLFVDGGLGNTVPEYQYLQLTAETKTGETTSHYTFDASYGNVLYDYEDGVIGNTGTEPSAESNLANANANIKYYYTPTNSTITTRYPFLPILADMPSFRHTDTPYFKDAGVDNEEDTTDSYVNRDYNFVAECHGHFLYEENRNLYFSFEGDDDVYLFVNGQLVLDIGGAHSIADQKILLNDYVTAAHTAVSSGTFTARDQALALEDGNNYRFDLYYMERHGYGANLQISTNIRVYNENITTEKFAEQNGTRLEDYGIAQFGSELSYGFSITNNSDETAKPLINYQFKDQDLGLYIGYDMECETSTLGSYNGTDRLVTEIGVKVTDADGNIVKQWAPGSLLSRYALRDLMDDLTFNDPPVYDGITGYKVEEGGEFFLKLDSPNWFTDDDNEYQKIAMWAWEYGQGGKWFTFEKARDPETGEPVPGVYVAALDAGTWYGFQLFRMDKSVTLGNSYDISSYWNRTGDILFENGKNCLEGFAYSSNLNGAFENRWTGGFAEVNAASVKMGVYKRVRRGLNPGETLTVYGIKGFIPANYNGVYTNTVTVKAGVNPGSASLHLIGAAGSPVYYAGVGQKLTVPLRTLLREAGCSAWDQTKLYRCTVTGFRQNDTTGEAVINRTTNNLELNFETPGVKQLYFTYTGNTTTNKIHITVYVYDAADSIYALDFGGAVTLGSGSDEAFTANDTLSISGNSTVFTHEVISDAAPVYDEATNSYSYPVSGTNLWALHEPTETPPTPTYSVTVSAVDSNLTVSGGTVANGVSTQTVEENTAMTSVTVMPTDPVRYAIPAPTITGGDVTATFTPADDILFFNLASVSWWTNDCAVQSAYFYDSENDQNNTWRKLMPVTETVYACQRPSGYDRVILVRQAPATYFTGGSGIYWDSKWNESENITLPAAGGDNYLANFRYKDGNNLPGTAASWSTYSGTNPFGGYTVTGSSIKATTAVTFPAAVERLNSFQFQQAAYNNANETNLNSSHKGVIFLTDDTSRITGSKSEHDFTYVEKIYCFDANGALLANGICSNATQYNAVKASTELMISLRSEAGAKTTINALLSSGTPYVTYHAACENNDKANGKGNFIIWSGNPTTVGQTVTATVSANGNATPNSRGLNPTLAFDFTEGVDGFNGTRTPTAASAWSDTNKDYAFLDCTYYTDYLALQNQSGHYQSGLTGRIKIYDSDEGINRDDLRYVVIRYRTSYTNPVYIAGTSTKATSIGLSGQNGVMAVSKLNLSNHSNEWTTEVFDLQAASAMCSNWQVGTTSNTYSKTFATIDPVKTLLFSFGKNEVQRVEIAYIAFFDNQADAETYGLTAPVALVGETAGGYYKNGEKVTPASGESSVSYPVADGSFTASISGVTGETPSLQFTPGGILTAPRTVYITTRIRSAALTDPAYLGKCDIHNEVELVQAVTIVPANVAYYENNNPGITYETVAQSAGNPYVSASSSGTVPTQSAGQSGAYGYDANYNSESGNYSGGGSAEITYFGNIKLASFPFTGTGFDLITPCGLTTGNITVKVLQGGSTVKTVTVSSDYSGSMYQVPLVSVTDLTYGSYTVEIYGMAHVDLTNWRIERVTEGDPATVTYYMVSKSDASVRWQIHSADTAHGNAVWYSCNGTETTINPATGEGGFILDGVRIYNGVDPAEQADYYNSAETNVSFTELRTLLTTGKATAVNYSDGKTSFTDSAFTTTIELTHNNGSGFTLNDAGAADLSYYFLFGPKHEIYLNGYDKTQAIAFSVTPDGNGERTLQIAAKRVLDSGFTSNGGGQLSYRTKSGWKTLNASITSGTEMYYTIDPTLCPQVNGAYLVVIATGVDHDNTSGCYLSLTRIKSKGWIFQTDYDTTTDFVRDEATGVIIGIGSANAQSAAAANIVLSPETNEVLSVQERTTRKMRIVSRMLAGDELVIVPPEPTEPEPTDPCAGGHSYENGVCTVCGALADGVYGSSITLNGLIGVNFYLTLSDPEHSVVYVNGEPCEGVRVVQPDGIETWRFTAPVCAQDMHKEQTIWLTVNGETHALQVRDGAQVESWTTSVQAYLSQLADSDDALLARLIRAISNYGRCAQLLFESEDALEALYEDAAISPDLCTEEALAAYQPTLTGSADGVEYIGSSLLLCGTTSIRHYFRLHNGLTPDALSASIDGAEAALVCAEGDLYYVEISDISARNLSRAYSMTLCRGEESITLRYAALSYVGVALCSADSGTELIDACRALYVYWKMADAYFSAEGGDAQ